jgi:predicted transcriptional regulator
VDEQNDAITDAQRRLAAVETRTAALRQQAIGRRDRAGVVLSVRVSSDLLEPLERLARQDDQPLSRVVRRALEEYITRRTSNPVRADAPQASNEAAVAWVYSR